MNNTDTVGEQLDVHNVDREASSGAGSVTRTSPCLWPTVQRTALWFVAEPSAADCRLARHQ